MASTYQAYNLPYNHPQQPQPHWTSNGPQNGTYPPPNAYNTYNSKPPTPLGAHRADSMTATVNLNDARRDRMTTGMSRTPSPTPSEQKELATGAIDWKAVMNWRFWIRREWLWYYVLFIIILVITALTTIFHKQIVNWLTPVTRWLHDLKFGWLVPIGILFVISFPPLFGHEIVAVLCGLVWGLWIGFAIVCAGTFIGEVGNFYAFKYCCRARGEKMEKNKLSYACLAKVVRDGGFKIAFIARLSAIPGHFTTAVFSTCGMGIFVFCIAAFLSLPKQFVTVYLGVILEQSGTGTETTESKIISDSVVAVTIIITFLACWYILRQMNKAKPAVIYERRKARQAKMLRDGLYGNGNMSGSDVFNTSETNIPLTAPSKQTQGYRYGSGQGQIYPFGNDSRYGPQSGSGDNMVYAPKAQHGDLSYVNKYGSHPEDGSDLVSEESSGSGHGVQYVTPGAGANAYNYTPTRQSTDEVGFEMGGYAGVGARSGVDSHPRTPPGILRTQSPEAIAPPTTQLQQSYHQPTSFRMPQPMSHPYSTQSHSFSTSHQPEVAQTPTQAQYAIYNPSAVASPTRSPGRLPTPGPSSPFDDPAPAVRTPTTATAYVSHQAEPTDLTFHTAMGSASREPSDGFTAGGASGEQRQNLERTFSPPPSYTSDLGHLR